MSTGPLTIAGRALRSRLILGTGGFPRLETLADAIRARGTELVTVALRRDRSGRARLAVDVLDELRRASCCRTPRAASRRATPCSPRSSRARRSGPTGSSSRSSATSARCCPTRPSCSPPPSSSSTTASSCCPTRPTTRSSRAAWRTSAARRSCRSARRSAPGMGIRNPYNLALIVERARRAGRPRRGRRDGRDAALAHGARLRRGAVRERDLARRGPGRDGARDPRSASRRGRLARARAGASRAACTREASTPDEGLPELARRTRDRGAP